MHGERLKGCLDGNGNVTSEKLVTCNSMHEWRRAHAAKFNRLHTPQSTARTRFCNCEGQRLLSFSLTVWLCIAHAHNNFKFPYLQDILFATSFTSFTCFRSQMPPLFSRKLEQQLNSEFKGQDRGDILTEIPDPASYCRVEKFGA